MRKCPKCGSENIESEVLGGHRTGDKICKDCGYVGWVKDFEAEDKKDSQQEPPKGERLYDTCLNIPDRD
ncbi:MAG: TFIIB-type zinc ribbon-containing protein [Sulfuricurvum sp.]|nr:TFIIB-type zinc ribbon-containing protein [Sulfuricurvum sp.]